MQLDHLINLLFAKDIEIMVRINDDIFTVISLEINAGFTAPDLVIIHCEKKDQD